LSYTPKQPGLYSGRFSPRHLSHWRRRIAQSPLPGHILSVPSGPSGGFRRSQPRISQQGDIP